MPECTLCNVEMTPDEIDQGYIEQTVFVTGPKKNGACLATDTGNKAHAECVKKAMVGVAPDQMALFD